MNIKLILLSILCFFVAQTMVWFQGFGSLKIQWLANNKWILYASAIPITWFFITGIELGVKGFGGQMWEVRLITFAVGILVFAGLTHHIIGEVLTLKSIISVALALSIVLIQVFWK